MRDELESSRYGQRSKKRKTNLVLNSLIVIVLLLIIFVSAKIFMGDDEQASSQEDTQVEQSKAEEGQEQEEDPSTSDEKSDEEPADSESTDSETNQAEETTTNETETTTETEGVVVEESNDPNVIKTIFNPAWEPVGTNQTGEHTNVYSGVDWDEMVQAITYATGLSEDDMTIQFLGNNGHNKSVGTVYSKNKEEIYKVYIEWVDNQGWKPTKVEQLATIEERKKTT